MMMDRRQRAGLDRYITGNYGEDQFIKPFWRINLAGDTNPQLLKSWRAMIPERYLDAYDIQRDGDILSVEIATRADADIFFEAARCLEVGSDATVHASLVEIDSDENDTTVSQVTL